MWFSIKSGSKHVKIQVKWDQGLSCSNGYKLSLMPFSFNMSDDTKGVVRNYQGGGLQILKYFKVDKLRPLQQCKNL